MNLAASLQDLPNLAAHPRTQRELQRAGKYLPTVVTALLVIAIAWQLARITWLLLPAPANEPALITASPIIAPQASDSLNAQKLADAHLFGVATVADNADINSAPQTQMTLVLAGVLAAPDPTKGFAFIGESAAAAKFHRVGDVLGGAAKLHSVYVDRVMLDRGGRLESLMLPRLTSSTMPQMAASPPPMPARFAENVRRIAETNPSAFSEIVRPQPVFNGAKLQGYRVYPGRNRQQFIKLGLRPGDMVTAVSGTPLTDQSSAMQIFNTIASTDRVTLTVEREGQTQQVNINTAQIDLPDPNTPPVVPAMTSPQQPPSVQTPPIQVPSQPQTSRANGPEGSAPSSAAPEVQ